MANRTRCPECDSPTNVKPDGSIGYHVRPRDLQPCGAVGSGAAPKKKRSHRKKKAT